MKENHYDDQAFFEKYKDMPRSRGGLQAAGEWHEFKKFLPNMAGKRVLDLGCGYGWHCRYAAEHGAQYVVGTDLSERMLEEARRQTGSNRIEYLRIAVEDIGFAPNSFDVVLSSLVFHYVEDFNMVCDKVANCLVSGGAFLFSVEHPIFTAYGTQDWIYGRDQKPMFWPVDNYFMEGKRDAVFLGERVTKFHHTLTTYMQSLLGNGFAVTGFTEPQPEESMKKMPGMEHELRRPMMLILAAQKV